ncbi:MAG: hypothetical protein DRH08_00045 [Deltaproteobacteria bacterium]|nr:MAG: hypothetical protein DRH08_00045 [Deltaproteobacteria bacterium]
MTRDQVESLLETFDDDVDAWRERRRLSLGGSDLFPIIYPEDIGGYSSEWSLWANKVHGRDADDQSLDDKDWLAYGHDVEPGIVAFAGRKMTAEDPTLKVVPYRNAIFPDPGGAPLHFSPDALVYRKPGWELVGGVDAKRVNVFHWKHAEVADQWGDAGTSTMPRRCTVQGVAGCSLFDVPSWVFAADRGTVPELFPLLPSDDDKAALRDVATTWWQRFIVGDEEPQVDGSNATSDALKALFDSGSEEVLAATDEDLDILDALRIARDAFDAAKGVKQGLENRLKHRIGTAKGIRGVATWGWCKGRKSLDADPFCNDIAAAVAEAWVLPMLLAGGMDPDEARATAIAEARLVVQTSRNDNTNRGEPYRRFGLTRR